jgi:hypothetical protein
LETALILTPDLLKTELAQRGYVCSKRTLLDWVQKRLLPHLSERGRGRALGKEYFWTDAPLVLRQAIAVHVLRRLRYPTYVLHFSLWAMGFPSDIASARSGWLLQMERMQIEQSRKAARVEKKRGTPFSHFSDRASELSVHIAQKLSKAFLLDDGPVASATMELYSSVFGQRFELDTETLEHSMRLLAQVTGFADPEFSKSELIAILQFLKIANLDFAHSLAKHATDEELQIARNQWLQLVALISTVLPHLNDDTGGLTEGDFLTVKFSLVGLLPFLDLIRRGKRREVSITLENVSRFLRRHDIPKTLPQILMMVTLNSCFRTELVSLLNDLSILWRHRGYPFSKQ